MKLTWFGGTALRVYVGGEIVVIDAENAAGGVDRGEFLAGANHLLALGKVPEINPAFWRNRQIARAIDDQPPLEIHGIGPAALLVAAAGEPPLVVVGPGEPPRFGRWSDGAVIVVCSAREGLVADVTVILDVSRPRLVALAVDEQTLDTAIEDISEHLDGAGLVSLEPGLALEV
jgi:hypothetical protein